MAAHLIDVRHYFAREIGVVGWNPVASALEFARGIDDVGQVPPLEKLREAWLDISAAVTIGMSSIDAKQFSRPLLRSLPFGATTLQAGLTFLLQHEMYHIGQIAMLRKELGYDAMSWSEPQY